MSGAHDRGDYEEARRHFKKVKWLNAITLVCFSLVVTITLIVVFV